ncbi:MULTISPECIES: hypothetical protein [unclassified Cupriavidus]|uniref:hypothetical protein n=1 Tax=unclassified Cupriavidus TaxID=2640874 RepID=UPI001AE97525|nr:MULTISPECIES: hypothetical protein [unclassified Cupriavidus]MBP0633132.1 hypothetical protein [Cupriavidus sp. AcVe19-1a]MBP0639772.1 hypothetical protein [Cupriavidus sp. AcVe19-6a]
MRVNIESGIVSRSMRCLLLSSLAIGLHTAHAAAALDFGYRIDGPANVRPTLVFNDGENTYIQPSGSARTQVAGATADGPYLRLPGIPESFVARIGSISLQVKHIALPSGPASAPAYGATQSRYQAASPLHQPLAGDAVPRRDLLADGNSSLKPAGATSTDAVTKDASNDGGGDLRSGAARSAAVPGRPASREGAAPAASENRDGSDVSYLAKAFGADGIREGANGSIQIRFPVRPSGGIQFVTETGKRLSSSWDDRTGVMTIDPSPTFLVRDGRSSAIVTREVADTFHFPGENAAGLDQVFSERGNTYLRVSDGTKKVTVRVDGRIVKGQQKGRYYRVNGIGDTFVVDADGFEVTVTRSRSIRFSDRAVSSS